MNYRILATQTAAILLANFFLSDASQAQTPPSEQPALPTPQSATPPQSAPAPQSPPAPAQPAPVASAPVAVDQKVALSLIRYALIALDQANKTGNYSVLREIGAPGFQANSPAQLSEIFAPLRKNGAELSGVAVGEPQFTNPPQIGKDGLLHIVGFFPAAPLKLNFDVAFQPVNNLWRIVALGAGFGDPSKKQK